ncbi:bifunctional metallophosphatase/5'-nucleotidase [Paraflavisolibacter sp. H34]|uniref:bifunctional metallophosphatase/5'-nucleotidase n=1 Tax=Huijunlia imazamoxiresistens TaxID=3127457 RepID=UPI003016119E
MNQLIRCACGLLLLGTASCSVTGKASKKDDHKIEVVFVQVNDVYEIAPLAGGKEGGMARVASLKKEYLKKNPNTFLVMAGDFLSPSIYNSLKFGDQRIRGRQMVEAMNAVGTDLVVFGNHEFDIAENELQDRINESRFQWISSNTFHLQNGQATPFARLLPANLQLQFPQVFVLNVKDADGTRARIGFIGLTLPFNKAPYVSYTDPLQTAKELYNRLKDSVDAVVAITHQAVEEDRRLAREVPGLAAILGGHEHDMRFEKEGGIFITKAHANAKSAYVLRLQLHTKKGKVEVEPDLRYLDEKVPLDSATTVVVNKWMDIAAQNFGSLGFDARKVVLAGGNALDGRETSVRGGSTDLTRLVVAALADAAPQADVVLMNAGSIRVDDYLHPPITQYDILRTMPFGGGLRLVDMKGALLLQTLQQGRKNKDTGGFLHFNDALTVDAAGTWKLKGAPLEAESTYRVALTDFLLTGMEANMDFLTPANPAIVKVYDPLAPAPNAQSDIRLAVVKYLEKKPQ